MTATQCKLPAPRGRRRRQRPARPRQMRTSATPMPEKSMASPASPDRAAGCHRVIALLCHCCCRRSPSPLRPEIWSAPCTWPSSATLSTCTPWSTAVAMPLVYSDKFPEVYWWERTIRRAWITRRLHLAVPAQRLPRGPFNARISLGALTTRRAKPSRSRAPTATMATTQPAARRLSGDERQP